MRLNVSVRDPQVKGVSTTVVVDTESSAQAGRLAAELTRSVGGHRAPNGMEESEPILYIGSDPVDPAATLQIAGVRDGMDLGLGTPVPTAPEPEGHTEVRVVSGPGAGTVFRLVPGDYDIGSGTACRIRLAEGSPALAARVRLKLDGTAQLLLTNGALLDGRPVETTIAWREGSLLTVGDTLLELTSRWSARAPLTTAPDGLGLEFNRPPRFLPSAVRDKFRLPTSPIKPDKRPIPLLPILLLPAASAAIAIFVTKNWTFVFIALLSPIAALITQFGSRKQTMIKYLEKKQEFDSTLARVHADIDAAVLEEQRNLRLSLPDPASLLQMAAQPSERLWERRWRDRDFLSVRVGTADLPSSLSVDDPAQDEHRRITVPWLNQVPVAVPMREAGVTGVAGPGAGRLASWVTAQAASLHSPADLRVVVLAGPDGEKQWSWTRWLPHTQAQGEDAYALVGSTPESMARRVGELGQIVASRLAIGRELVRGGANGYPDILVVLEQARRARSLPGVIALLRDGPSVGVHMICIDHEERLLPEECGAVIVTAAGSEGMSRVRTGVGAGLQNVRTDSPEPGWYEALGRALAPLRGVGDTDESVLPGSVRLLDLLNFEPPTPEAVVAGWALGGRSTRAVLGRVLSRDQQVVRVRSLIQIIEARRWRPAR